MTVLREDGTPMTYVFCKACGHHDFLHTPKCSGLKSHGYYITSWGPEQDWRECPCTGYVSMEDR